MADPRHVIEALRRIEAGLQQFMPLAGESMSQAAHEIARLQADLDRRQIELERELSSASATLSDCQDNYTVDEEGNRHYSDCSTQTSEVNAVEDALDTLRRLRGLLEDAAQRYEMAASRFRSVLDRGFPAATFWLREREAALIHFERAHSDNVPDASAVAVATVATTLVAMLSSLGGGHGALYRKSRQQYLRGLVNDPNQPRYVRGWIAQQLNRLEQVKNARRLDNLPPGGNPRHVRGIPGLDVGHRFPDIDLPENFRLEEAAMNRARPGIAKRLGLAEWLR
jgi:tetratricopeptide (TPR) repeat protein